MRVAVCDDNENFIKTMEEFMKRLKQIYSDLEWQMFDCAEKVLEYCLKEKIVLIY